MSASPAWPEVRDVGAGFALSFEAAFALDFDGALVAGFAMKNSF